MLNLWSKCPKRKANREGEVVWERETEVNMKTFLQKTKERRMQHQRQVIRWDD